MHPPAGRVKVGDRIRVPSGQPGTVVAECVFGTNGASRYTIRLDDGTTAELLDFELRLAS